MGAVFATAVREMREKKAKDLMQRARRSEYRHTETSRSYLPLATICSSRNMKREIAMLRATSRTTTAATATLCCPR